MGKLIIILQANSIRFYTRNVMNGPQGVIG